MTRLCSECGWEYSGRFENTRHSMVLRAKCEKCGEKRRFVPPLEYEANYA